MESAISLVGYLQWFNISRQKGSMFSVVCSVIALGGRTLTNTMEHTLESYEAYNGLLEDISVQVLKGQMPGHSDFGSSDEKVRHRVGDTARRKLGTSMMRIIYFTVFISAIIQYKTKKTSKGDLECQGTCFSALIALYVERKSSYIAVKLPDEREFNPDPEHFFA